MQEIAVLSIGTGATNAPVEVDPVNQGQLPWVKALVEILMGSNQELGTALGKNMLNAVGVFELWMGTDLPNVYRGTKEHRSH